MDMNNTHGKLWPVGSIQFGKVGVFVVVVVVVAPFTFAVVIEPVTMNANKTKHKARLTENLLFMF